MRRILLPVALLAVSVALFLAFYDGATPGSPETVARMAEDGMEASEDATPDDELPPVGTLEGEDRTRSDTPITRRDTREVGGIMRVVRGEVVVAPSCSSDDELMVYAWSEEVDADDHQFMTTTEVGESLSGATLIGTSAVEPDKSYLLEMMTDLEEVQLYVRGRFAASAEGQLTELTEGGSQAYLTTQCGACIEGELLGMGDEDPTLIDIELTLANLQMGRSSRQAGFASQDVHPDKDGRFTLRAVPAERSFEIRVEPVELAPDLIDIEPLTAGKTRTVRLELRKGASITGKVVGSNGLPIPDARVRSRGGRAFMALAGWARKEAQSDENGEFIFHGLPTGEVIVTAEKDGFLDSGFEVLKLTEGEERDDLVLVLTEGNSIEGTVRWPDGEPVANARVVVEFDRSALFGADSINAARGGDGSAQTDDEGGFRVTALGRGPFTVAVSHVPEGPRLEDWLAIETRLASLTSDADLDEDRALGWTDQAEGVRPDAPPIDLVLSAPEVIGGRVVNDFGAAVEEYELILVRLEDSVLGDIGVDTLRQQVVDPEGRFIAAGLSKAGWRVYALAEGYSVPEPIEVKIPQPEGSDPLLITLEPASVASGMVLTPDGTPAVSAQVMVKMGVAGLLSNISEDLKEPTTLSKAGGEFRLEGLHSGVVELIATAEGYATSSPVQVTLVPGEETSGLRLMLLQGGTITGELYNKAGDLTPNATIQVVKPDDYTIELTSTDSDGAFRFEHLEPGNWQVIGIPNLIGALDGSEDNQGGRAELLKDIQMSVVELEEGGEVHVVLGAPPEDPVLLSGVIRHLDEPVEGATLVFIIEGEQTMPKIGVSDSHGRYSVRLDKPGQYLFTVQRMFDGAYMEQSQNTFRVTVPKTVEHHYDIDLPGAGISGRVTTKSGASPGRVPITLSPNYEAGYSPSANSTVTQISCAEDGSFSIDGVLPGKYFLRAGGLSLGRRVLGAKADATSDFGQATLALQISEDEILDDVRLVVEEGGSLEVRVVNTSGSPVSGASLFIRDEGGQPIELISVVTTDSNGVCEYPGLAEGNYQVSARTKDSATIEGTLVHIRAGATESIEIQMDQGTLLKVTVTDTEGNPVNAMLRVVDSGGREHSAYLSLQMVYSTMGEDGFSGSRQVVGPLPPGRYRVYARTADGRESDKPVSLRGQEVRSIRLRIR